MSDDGVEYQRTLADLRAGVNDASLKVSSRAYM